MKKIISGGQTGADQAGLDAAIATGLEYGGSIPKGRKTETGPLSMIYDQMTELHSPSYPLRTIKNIVDSDATIIFTMGAISGGSALTLREAIKRKKPCFHVDLSGIAHNATVLDVAHWLNRNQPEVLNVAGSRASKAPEIWVRVYQVLVGAIGVLRTLGEHREK